MHIVWNGPMIAFFITSILILICAIMMLSFRKVVYMALTMGAIFVGCAALYIILGAEFVGVAQILIYAGAITILIMFAIMLTNHEDIEPPFQWNARNVLSAIGCILLGLTLYLTIRKTTWPQGDASVDINHGQSNTIAVGLAMFKQYTVPFELVSLLLIVALVGAVILTQNRKEDDE